MRITARLAPRKRGAAADLMLIDAADHTFHLRGMSERSDAEARGQAMDIVAQWSRRIVSA
jgi:dienelactone hydrolase